MKTAKNTLLVALSFIFTTVVFAQTSEKGFSFQGYAIDPEGKALTTQQVTVKFTLSPGTFEEEHQVTTDGFGVFHAIIGNSSATKNAEFAKLDFTKKGVIYTLKVEVKKTIGGAYTTISNEPMKAVPYARHAENGVPVGTVVSYAGDKNNVPEGWLLCNGASVAQADYPRLYAAIGSAWGASGSSFNLPDLRGRFLRGVAEGQVRAPDRASRVASAPGGNSGDQVGTIQGDQFGAHNHNVSASQGSHTHSYNDAFANPSSSGSSKFGTGSGDLNNPFNPRASDQVSRTTGSGGGTAISVYQSNAGGSETRPENAGVYFIIKY